MDSLGSTNCSALRRSSSLLSRVELRCRRLPLVTTMTQMRESSTPLLFPVEPVVKPVDLEVNEEIEQCMAALLLQLLEIEAEEGDDDDS